jgi:ABC-type bacteriocin/lantibiotic exporter with double-glycine peptidase domain
MEDSHNTQQTQPEADLRTVHSGLYGLCLIGRHHQQDMDMRQLMHDHAVGGEELSLKELARIAAHHQLKAKCIRIAWKACEKYQPVLPCLVRKTDGHYAIICGLRKERPPEAVAAAEINLGIFYLRGTGVKPDQEEAQRHFKKAAELDPAMAEENFEILGGEADL